MAHEVKTAAGTLTKNELVRRFQEILPYEMNKEQSKMAVDALCQTIHDSLLNGDNVTIYDVGTLNAIDKPERQARNPMTGETVTVAPNMTCKFKISPKLKQELKDINPNKRKSRKFY